MKLAGKKGWLHHVLCVGVCGVQCRVGFCISGKQVGMTVTCHRPPWQTGVLQNGTKKYCTMMCPRKGCLGTVF